MREPATPAPRGLHRGPIAIVCGMPGLGFGDIARCARHVDQAQASGMSSGASRAAEGLRQSVFGAARDRSGEPDADRRGDGRPHQVAVITSWLSRLRGLCRDCSSYHVAVAIEYTTHSLEDLHSLVWRRRGAHRGLHRGRLRQPEPRPVLSGGMVGHLKDTYGDHITFWGGGVDTQRTLPFSTPEEVRREVLSRPNLRAGRQVRLQCHPQHSAGDATREPRGDVQGDRSSVDGRRGRRWQATTCASFSPKRLLTLLRGGVAGPRG